ncbi:ATP-binding cassette domain-containing protein [Kocuria sp.]|uniref:ATP-binding cassette domain-containing protein n=1 Tax=Kocuria sp. TaxID=1871328 RepID=UPI0026DF6B99|nr:ATP-binding cassette domain-containing protein [Kocuria sp.]MDO5619103.1 ATP-binding cassette domain-containing protein [Kocuria sp.]
MYPLSIEVNGTIRTLDPWRPWTVGASPYADIQVSSAAVQDIHVILRWSGDCWTVEDRGTRTGTALNGYMLMANMAAIISGPTRLSVAPNTGAGAELVLRPREQPAPQGEAETSPPAANSYGFVPPSDHPQEQPGHTYGIVLPVEDHKQTGSAAEHGSAETARSAQADGGAQTPPSANTADRIHSGDIPVASAEPTVAAISINRSSAGLDAVPGQPGQSTRDDSAHDPDSQGKGTSGAQQVDPSAPVVEAQARSWVNRMDNAEVMPAPHSPEDERSGMTLSPAVRAAVPGGSIVLGRDASADVLIDGLLVSRQHARITRAPDGATITDLGSTNGTWVDGRRISSTVALPVGSQVVIGGVPFRQTSVGLCELIRATGNMSIVVQDLTFSVPDRINPKMKRTLVDDISLEIPDRSLIAVIGPSGAGKSTFLNCLLGDINPDRGRIEYHGLDMSQFGPVLSSQIGMVPQEDVLHRDLTAQQVLEATAALRLPEDVDKQQRQARIAAVIDSLGLTEHARTPVKQLSGGQRKRVSTAMELLTGPRYLFLDEPTSGLDPDMDFEVMDLLRRMAHGEVGGREGSTVVVITHSTANLDLADKVLVLAPGGSVAYFGDPDGMMPYFERSQQLGPQVREIYKGLKEDPASAAAAFRTEVSHVTHERLAAQTPAGAQKQVTRRGMFQLGVLLRRQLHLMRTDLPSVIVTTFVAPALLALLVLVVPGEHGLNYPESTDSEINQPQIVLIVILLAAVAIGLFPACRTFLDEKRIFLREARTGLGVWPYVGAKTLVTIVISLIQSAILVFTVLALVPHDPFASWGPMWLELWIVTFLLILTSWLLGFLVSALVGRSDVAMNTASLLVVVQLIFSGGLFAMEGASDAASRMVPTRWAYAAMAQSGDLNDIVRTAAVALPQEEANQSAQETHDDAAASARASGLPEPPAPNLPAVDTSSAVLDPLWKQGTVNWWGSTALTGGFGLAFLLLSVLAIRRVKKRKH